MVFKTLIMILAYNAKRTIMPLLERIPKKTWEEVSEVLVLDDCSKDNTSELALNYKKQKKLSKLRVIRHNKNKGYGGNQKFGYNYAINHGFDFVVMVHGDIQYPPEYISPLLEPLKQGRADMTFGSRMSGHPIKGGMPLYKFFGNIFLTTIENLVLGTNLSEFHSGFRLYSCKALKDIPFNENSDDFHFDSEIIIQLVITGKKIAEMPIPTFYGNEKCNVKVISYGLNILKILGQYILNKYNIKKYKKFDIRKK